MSYSFPDRLFPTHYNSGPPNCGSKHAAGGWGEYKGILNMPVQGVSGETYPRFVPRRQTRGEPWSPSEPLVLPLLPPKPIPLWHLDSSDSTDLGQHMGNFYLKHYSDAFSSVSGLLRDHLDFCPKKCQRSGAMNLGWAADFLSKLKYKKCEYSYLRDHVVAYDNLLRDVIHDIPPALLGGLLREELQLTGQRLQFSEATTGGALGHAALPQDTCLVYANGPAFNLLNFQRVSLRSEEAAAPWLDASSKPTSVELKGPVRQISCSTLLTDCCVAVRSDYLCGVWRCNEVDKPKVLQVIKTRQPATCITASPHVLGEVLLADESGSAHLWTVGKGKTQVRHEDSNLYFNASSPWRWCEFSAHPRVMLYADRTGMELTDTRAANASGFTLFRIGQSPQCRSGERVVLGRYLADAHPFHHLVTTQYSAYIMDERFPLLPMLKWDHMMQAPPIFAQVLPGRGSSSTKVVIGSQSQEIIMLQYTGGSVEPCVSMGPPQELLRPRDSLDHLPVQLPHRTQDHHRRLALPASGLACFPGGRGDGGGEDLICVLQLTEAGDVFSQVLRPGAAGQGPAPPGETAAGSGGTGVSTQQSATSPRPDWGAEDTGSEDEVVGPTQPTGGPPAVPETPERAGASSCDEEDEEGWRGGKLVRYLGLEVVVNEEVGETTAAQPDGAAAPGALGDPTATAAVSDWTDQAAPPSARAAAVWRVWLQQLLRCRPACRAKPAGQKPLRTRVPGFRLSAARDPITEDCLQSLRRDLGESMASGSLLLHGATYLPHMHLPVLPDPVLPEAWPDSLSQRLTVSWQGEEQWRTWWLDKLGLNNKERAEALRRRRRKEKAKRRSSSLNASGGWTDLGSSWGWSSSATSQRGWSDTDDTVSRSTCWSEPGSPGSTVSQQQRSSPGLSLCRRSRVLSEGLAGSLLNPKEGSPRLFGMEDDPEPTSFCSQQAAGGGARTPGPLTPGPHAPGPPTPGPHAPGRPTPGRPTPGRPTPRASQASLGRPGTQSSQVKRKRSQMGF